MVFRKIVPHMDVGYTTIGLWFAKTPCDFKINKMWYGSVSLLHG
jgi:hypothetical protein